MTAIVSEWKQYTNQEAFEKSARHLLSQNAKSTSYSQYGGSCVYRSSSGLMCALGIFIPDEEVDELMSFSTVASNCGFDPDLAKRLRTIHDCNLVGSWRFDLKLLADSRDDLTWPTDL